MPEDDRAETDFRAGLRRLRGYLSAGDCRVRHSRLKPDVYVKGGDYATNQHELDEGKLPLPEAGVVTAYGGEVRTVPLIPDRSTTSLEQRIIERVCSARD